MWWFIPRDKSMCNLNVPIAKELEMIAVCSVIIVVNELELNSELINHASSPRAIYRVLGGAWHIARIKLEPRKL